MVSGLTLKEQKALGDSAADMIEDELTFLHNYTPCQRLVDCTLLAGHLRLVEALSTCEGIDKRQIGANLIPELLNGYLFPASRMIADGALNNQLNANNANNLSSIMNPKCDTSDSRVAAYNLLLELSKNCPENLKMISDELTGIHHSFNEDLAKDFEYEPAIERRASCNYVGLKNAGATCYMNSVLQQLYCVPGLGESVLRVDAKDDDGENANEESVFYQLQTVFGKNIFISYLKELYNFKFTFSLLLIH